MRINSEGREKEEGRRKKNKKQKTKERRKIEPQRFGKEEIKNSEKRPELYLLFV